MTSYPQHRDPFPPRRALPSQLYCRVIYEKGQVIGLGSPWKAVADDSRRQMLVLLKKGEKTPTEIAEHFSFTKPALSTHLRILSEAGLVSERKVGRNRLYSVRRDAMAEMMEFFDSFWEDKLVDLKRHVETKKARGRATSK